VASAIVHLGEHLGGGANGGERVLDLMRDVGSEGLDEAQVPFETGGELLQGARQIADLVAPSRNALSGRAMVVETRRLRTAATIIESRTTLKMSRRTS
jgi:hypothetical protein